MITEGLSEQVCLSTYYLTIHNLAIFCFKIPNPTLVTGVVGLKIQLNTKPRPLYRVELVNRISVQKTTIFLFFM